jgi:hypothetical protein
MDENSRNDSGNNANASCDGSAISNGSSTSSSSSASISSGNGESKPRRRVESVRWDLYRGPMVQIGGLWYPKEDEQAARLQYEEDVAAYSRQNREKWEASPQGKLCLELYGKFMEYKTYLEQHPGAGRHEYGADLDYPEHMLFVDALRQLSGYQQERAERDRKNLEKAQQAARCEHQYMDGEQCGAPRMKGSTLCRMHKGVEETRSEKLDLGPMEDPDSIQAAIRKLLAAIIDGKLDRSQISQITNLIQVAAWNVTRTTTGARWAEG